MLTIAHALEAWLAVGLAAALLVHVHATWLSLPPRLFWQLARNLLCIIAFGPFGLFFVLKTLKMRRPGN